MAKPKNYEELIRPFVREFGSALADLSPSQIDEISSLIMSGDIAGARQRMSYLAAAGRSAEYVPRGTKRYSPAKDAPGGELTVREARPSVNAGRAEQPKVPVAPEADARPAQPSFLRKVLTPLSMDVPRREFLPGDFRPDDTAGDAVRKILGYGVVPGAAVGMAARQLADGGGYFAATYPRGDDAESAEGPPSEEERRAASRARIEAQRERHFQEIMAERFRRKPGMASPRE